MCVCVVGEGERSQVPESFCDVEVNLNQSEAKSAFKYSWKPVPLSQRGEVMLK